MKWKAFFFIFIVSKNIIYSVVPIWDFYNSSIDLLSSDTSHKFNVNGENCYLEKEIKRDSNNIISYKKYLIYNNNKKEVEYENISYYYQNILGATNLICPRGKFHPYDLDNNLNKTNNFEEKTDWDLKCLNHKIGHFLIFYLNNKDKNLYFSKYSGEIKNCYGYFGVELYDFILEDISKEHNYQYNSSFIYSLDNNLLLVGGGLVMNSDLNEYKVDKVDKSTLNLTKAKNYSQAYFTSDYNFYYFSYNDVSDFLGGYSTSGVNPNKFSDISTVHIKNHEFSPIEFLNQVQIKKINFIPGTQYAYYEIKDLNTKNVYHGFMDIKQNKVLFNTNENITTFVPYSAKEMLAITPNSAYKICIIKDDNTNECLESCPNGNFILDTDGNKCKTDNSECDSGKLKLMPNNICVNESLCDEKIFVKNETYCGLCKEFYPNNKIYKLFNTSGCIDFIPNNTEPYNSNNYLKVYKCKENFHPYDNICTPDFCFPNCEVCYEASNDTNNQKCLTCKSGFYFDQNTFNCMKCKNERCAECTKESNQKELCTRCLPNYKTVNLTTLNQEFFYCLEEKEIPKRFYGESKDGITIYKPCYRKCKKCNKAGNNEQNNCLECGAGYMFRPGNNPYNNCIGYSEFIYQDAYGNINNLPNPQCPEEAKYKIKYKNSNKIFCIHDCKESITNVYLYNGNCVERCPEKTTLDNINFICKVDKNECSLGEDEIYIENNDTMKVVETLAKSYASEFQYTNKHIAKYNHQNFNIIIYKDSSCIKAQNLRMPTIDFLKCSEIVKKVYNVTELIAAVADRKSTKNPTSFIGFYHPISGIKLDSEKLCKDSNIQIAENLYVLLDEKNKNYFLQIDLTKQGINIFNEDNDFFNDICFEFDNPLSRDIPLKDRQKAVYPQAKLCDDDCHNEGIDLSSMTAICNCKYRDISQSKLEPVMDDLFGDAFELIDSSNIEVLKCHKKFFKYFTKSIGGIILIILIIADIIFSVLFFTIELIELKKYVLTITDNYLNYLKDWQKNGKNPPKKLSQGNKTSLIKFIHQRNQKMGTFQLNNRKKSNSIISSKERISIYKNKKINNDLKEKGEKIIINTKKIISFLNLGNDKMDKKFFEEYLATSIDDMEFDDAIIKDDRKFLEILCEILKDKQMIMNTFFASDHIKGRFIKIILFILNICLYLVLCGLFYSEDYISELYNLDKKDNFFSFFPRAIDKLIKSTIVSMVIAYLTDFFFLEEKKIIGLFRRERENRKAIKEYIILFLKDLQKRYISFLILVLVILIFSFYYLVCFNRVYPKTQFEWIKSSIVIMIIIQIISILKCLCESTLRILSFRFKSEKMFKISKIFD